MDKNVIIVDKNKYILEREYKNGFNKEDFLKRYTDYFDDYDYIFGDYSYDVLRLKGFNDGSNKNVKDVNNIKLIDSYISDYCSHECRWFLLKKIKK